MPRTLLTVFTVLLTVLALLSSAARLCAL